MSEEDPIKIHREATTLYDSKKYEEAAEHFMKSAEMAFGKSFDRFGVSALEYARDCYRQLGETEKVEELQSKINELKEKLSTSF